MVLPQQPSAPSIRRSLIMKISPKFFIYYVCKQAVKRYLVNTLKSKVLNPNAIAGLMDQQIALLAIEAPEVSRIREGEKRLKAKKVVLDKGTWNLKEALRGLT